MAFSLKVLVFSFIRPFFKCKLATEFSLLQEGEKKFGMKTNKGKDKFFRSGKAEQWKDLLSLTQIKKIEASCKQSMKELNYL